MAGFIAAHISWLKHQSRLTILSFGILTTFLLGLIDYLTGFEISFAFFYLLPVCLSNWFGGKRAGILISMLSATTWQVSNVLAGEQHNNLIFYWNTATRLGFFWVVSYLLGELKASYSKLEQLSNSDPLTGLLNRRGFFLVTQNELEQARRFKHPVTVIYLDIDNFKALNDQFGHDFGDTVLKTFGRFIQLQLRASDSIGRLGGDEFALLLPKTDETGAHTLVSRLEQNLQNELTLQGWQITFSIGVMTWLEAPQSVEQLLEKADGLMYQVKRTSKNNIAYGVYPAKVLSKV